MRNLLLGLTCLAATACGGSSGGDDGGLTDPGGTMATELATGATFQDAMGTGTGAALGKLVVDATHLYWFEYDGSLGQTGGRIRSVARAGGAVSVLASGLGGVNGLSVDGSHVYWTEFDIATGTGGLKRVPRAGGAVETLSSGHFFPTGPALSAANVYWGDRTGDGSIVQRPKSGGINTTLVTGTMMAPIAVESMAADATTLFWLEATSVHAVLLAGGGVSTLATGLSNLQCLAVDADTLYFMSQVVPRILYRLPKAGGSAATVETDGMTNLVSDGTRMLWARNETQLGAEVVRLPKAGGSEEILGAGGNLGVLFSIAVDGDDVYLLDIGANQSGMGRILAL
jgi:hypothetical protein